MSYLDEQLTEYKKYFAISSNTDDYIIRQMLSVAWTTAEQYIGLKFNEVYNSTFTETEYWIGNGETIFIPEHLPIVEVSELTINNLIVPEYTPSTASGYKVSLTKKWIVLVGYTFNGHCTLKHSYGWQNPPLDLKQAVYELTNAKLKRKLHIGQESVAGIQQEAVRYYPDDIVPQVREVFDRYRVHTL